MRGLSWSTKKRIFVIHNILLVKILEICRVQFSKKVKKMFMEIFLQNFLLPGSGSNWSPVRTWIQIHLVIVRAS